MRYTDGVPSTMQDLDTEPTGNRPHGFEADNVYVLFGHIRALSAFVAQLRDRVAALEPPTGDTHEH